MSEVVSGSTPTCPKGMTFGPCGGVRPDATCEVDARPCPFHARPTLEWVAEPTRQPREVSLGSSLIDLRLPPDDRVLAEVAAIFETVNATALVGEHVDDPIGHTPVRAAQRLAAVECPSIVTVTGRGRSVAEHETEIDGLVEAGVVAVHCVTGDHPAARFGPGHRAEFSLDGTELAAAARRRGARVSVGESPAAPPTAARPRRTAMKQAAGADIAVLNHAGPLDALTQFAGECAAADATLPLVAPVPVITSRESALALAQFPGLLLPAGLVERVLAADDPTRVGVDAAIEMATELLASGHFAAVNLSGSAGSPDPVRRAELMVEVAAALR